MTFWPAEYDGLLPQDTELAQKTNVPDVFGATQDDTDGLRIVSLQEVSSLDPHLASDTRLCCFDLQKVAPILSFVTQCICCAVRPAYPLVANALLLASLQLPV